MYDLVIFGGTTEGRQLADFCARTRTQVLVSVATDLGEQASADLPGVSYRVGRLDQAGIAALLAEAAPRMVVDATHPYASVVTSNVAAACAELGLSYLRVRRPQSEVELGEGARRFADLAALVEWLNQTSGVIFATTGAKEAEALTGVDGYEERIVLRILPLPEGVKACLDLGYPSAHLVAMQGPFGREINAAMFRHYAAKVLVSKDSGTAGGFADKLAAAADCQMTCAVLARPADLDGVGVAAAERIITKVVGGK
jgi:precorrin-6x reductase